MLRRSKAVTYVKINYTPRLGASLGLHIYIVNPCMPHEAVKFFFCSVLAIDGQEAEFQVGFICVSCVEHVDLPASPWYHDCGYVRI